MMEDDDDDDDDDDDNYDVGEEDGDGQGDDIANDEDATKECPHGDCNEVFLPRCHPSTKKIGHKLVVNPMWQKCLYYRILPQTNK